MRVLDEMTASGFKVNAPPSADSRNAFLHKLDFHLNDEFKEFIFSSDGATGFIADDVYLQIWSIEDMLALNPYHDDIEMCKEVFFFGSDGSNKGYAFIKSSGQVVSIDFLDIGSAIPSVHGESFIDFIRNPRAEP